MVAAASSTNVPGSSEQFSAPLRRSIVIHAGWMQPPPQTDTQHFARTSSRANRTLFGIQQGDRLHHVYIIGKTGTGKTTLLETLIRADLVAGRGIALLDPHGDLADVVKAAVPPTRIDQMIFVDLADPDCAIAYK